VRLAAIIALAAALVLAAFSGFFLLVPVAAALVAIVLRSWRSHLDGTPTSDPACGSGPVKIRRR
jgi:hypothetical protein